jgi:RND superfamily putative drug exporter
VKLTRLLVVVLTLLVWVGLAGVGGPLVLAQIAFIVAFGVLLDTLVVRSLLVPAFDHDLGARIWWPSRLGQKVPPDSDR